MSQLKDKDNGADTKSETNEHGHELYRTVWRKANNNGKNAAIYHLSPKCSYLESNDVNPIANELRELPHHRPCKGCMGVNYRAGPSYDKRHALIDLTDDKLSNSVYVTRHMWDNSHGVYHASSACTSILRADDFVELHIESIPNLTQEPCDFCCDDEIREIAEKLNERFAVDNPGERLTVGDLPDKKRVWVSLNSNNKSLAHLSTDCMHLDQANNPNKKMAQTLRDDRGLCKKCTGRWSHSTDDGRYNSLAFKLRNADNPKELLNEENTN
jgi:hypothetical protein